MYSLTSWHCSPRETRLNIPLDIPETKITGTVTSFVTWILACTFNQSPGLRYPMMALASKSMYAITKIDTKIGGTPNSINKENT